MCALFSGHLLCSPLVALFCCCIIRTTPATHLPPNTPALRQVSSQEASVPSQAPAASSSSERRHPSPQPDSGVSSLLPPRPQTPMETEEADIHQFGIEDGELFRTTSAPSDHALHFVIPQPVPLPAASPRPDRLPSRRLSEARARWEDHVHLRESHRQQTRGWGAQGFQCTHTRFPINTVSFVGQPGFTTTVGKVKSVQNSLRPRASSLHTEPALTHHQQRTGDDVIKTNVLKHNRHLSRNKQKYSLRQSRRHDRQKRKRDLNHVKDPKPSSVADDETAVNFSNSSSNFFTSHLHSENSIRHNGGSLGKLVSHPRYLFEDSQDIDENSDKDNDGADSRGIESASSLVHAETDHSRGFRKRAKKRRITEQHRRHPSKTTPSKDDVSSSSSRQKPRHHPNPYLSFPQRRFRRSANRKCWQGHCPSLRIHHPRTSRSASDPEQGSPKQSSRPEKSQQSGLSPDASDLGEVLAEDVAESARESRAAEAEVVGRFGRAVYLSGQQMLKLKPAALVTPGQQAPGDRFSVELWVKAEGGQYDPAIIVALTDTCGGFSPGGYWALGIRTQSHQLQGGGGGGGPINASPPTDARFFFSLKTARAVQVSTVWADRRYQHSAWTHLAASYDGHKMALYVNGALLAVSHEQSREVFPPAAAAAACKALTVGSVVQSATAVFRPSPVAQQTPFNFRGSVDELRLWRRVLSQEEVRQHVQDVMTLEDQVLNNPVHRSFPPSSSSSSSSLSRPGGAVPGSGKPWRQTPDLYLYEGFQDLNYWSTEAGKVPVRLVSSDLSYSSYDLSVPVPACGQTPCDNPDVVFSYARHTQLRSAKQIRYRIINLMNDNGSKPTVTKQQIRKQHRFLNRAFQPYNISFELEVQEVRNSTLRKRLVVLGCALDLVGDGICNPECRHDQTGQDGGDCDDQRTVCPAHKKGNGRCDFECNKEYHNWDGGDCCRPDIETHYTCYDPSSPYRAYVTVEEVRELVGLPCDSHLNVFFAVFSDQSGGPPLKSTHLIGLATFPWENNVYAVQGGAVIQHQTFGTGGQMDSLVHEMGHVLGLWHVHHGVSEIECSDPCAETHPSMVLGDLCSDTAPTSHNVHCRDPQGAVDHCGLPATYTDTPYSNYMSYADDNCTDHFTPQQVARMHCYLDLVYQPWRTHPAPTPVPLPPTVVAANASSVTIAWLSPLGGKVHPEGSLCSLCNAQGALVQFAAVASSPIPSSSWSPDQATGPPDAEPCVPSTRAWLPEVVYPDLVASGGKKSPCRLDLSLHVPVLAHTLTLWVTWNADGIRRLKLVFEDDTTSVIKAVPAFCDMPFTLTLNYTKRLRKVQVYTRTPFTAIDALQVVSRPGHASCQACQPTLYRVFRQPQIRGQRFRQSQKTQFTDREVQRGVRYRYWVETVSSHSHSSQPSPALHYTHGQAFCGDARVDRPDEDCDDGNIVPGDGCDVTCHIEHSFHCKGSPSVCYRHDGDGVCEDFERQSSVLDCGFYTPDSYLDQWSHYATASPHHTLPSCPARLATGIPTRSQLCGPFVDPRSSWNPCGAPFDIGDFWIEFYIARPVVATAVIVHLAADGRTEADPTPKTLSVRLITVDNSTQPLTPQPVVLDCRHTQLYLAVVHNLSMPFYKTQGVRLSFESANISIAAVRVRSYRYLDPVTLASCSGSEVYNPHTGVCLAQNCLRTPCRPLVVPHGTALCTGEAEGDVCRVTCVRGYRPQSPTMEMTCRGRHWVPAQPVACVPVECGRAAMPGAALTCAWGTSFGQNCTFQCQPPATLHGSDNWIVCEEDGLWSMPRAQCLVTCSPPLQLKHVSIHKKRCRSGRLAVGSRCKMRCQKGYHVAGARSATRRVFRLTCEGDGTWSGGHCERVTCPKFDPVFTGLISCTDGVKVASRCTLMCPGSDEAQIVTCKADGQWTMALTLCSQFEDITCPDPRDVSKLELRCPSRVVGAQCGVSCPTPEYVAMFNLRRGERRAPLWQVVNSITCTGTGKWFPPLDHVTCVEQCSEEFIGDTWCDARNNRPYCRWDGGDCCQSTLGTTVRTFLEGCGDACTCKDPKAVENRGQQSSDGAKRRGG